MNEIVVRITNKYIGEAFQQWCFDNKIPWNDNSYEKKETDNVCNLCITSYRTILICGKTHDYILSSQWNEAIEAVLEMLDRNEKKYTSADLKDKYNRGFEDGYASASKDFRNTYGIVDDVSSYISK